MGEQSFILLTEERFSYGEVSAEEAQLFFEYGIAVECDGDKKEVLLKKD